VIRASFWLAVGLAILMLFWIPTFIEKNGVATGLSFFLFWETISLIWAYRSIKPYLTVRHWEREGKYKQRAWSPEERRLQRGKILVYMYGATNANHQRTVPLDKLKEFGGWTLAELHNLLSPLRETGIIDVEMRSGGGIADTWLAFSEARIKLTPTGVLATEDAVMIARQRPGYSVTIHGNDNQVQVASVNSEQLRNT
jgi:hypothetical protein